MSKFVSILIASFVGSCFGTILAKHVKSCPCGCHEDDIDDIDDQGNWGGCVDDEEIDTPDLFKDTDDEML